MAIKDIEGNTEFALTMKSLVDPVMSPLSFPLITKVIQDRKVLDRLYPTSYGVADLPYLEGNTRNLLIYNHY